MSYTTIIKQDGTVTQDTTTSFTDGRIWKLANGESLRIWTSGTTRKIFKMGVDGAKLDESDIINNYDSDPITIAVNREETTAYLINKRFAYNILDLRKLDIATMTLTTLKAWLASISGALRAIIDKTGEKIIWLGDDRKLYKMDLDGGNLENVNFGSIDIAVFCMDVNNFSYLAYSSYITTVSPTLIKTSKNIGGHYTDVWIDSFALKEYIYFIRNNKGINPNRYEIIKYKPTDESFIVKDIGGDYGISDNVCQFNASGFDNFGTFFGEKDGVMRRWQVNLDNLECTPARWETYPTKQVFSNDTNLSLVDYSGVNGNNCDNCGRITSKFGCTGAV